MSKYYVTYKKSDSKGVIESLFVHPVSATGWDSTRGYRKTRPEVVTAIKAGDTFDTVYKSNGTWTIGARVAVFPVTTDYLKTKPDSIAADNLDNLPEG